MISKAFCYLTSCPRVIQHNGKQVEILRILTQSNDGISAQNCNLFWMVDWTKSVEAAEFMWSQGCIPSESDISDDEEVFPMLAAALREFGRDPSHWEGLLRRQVRKDAALHSPVPRFYHSRDSDEIFNSIIPCRISKYGTPLDDLFLDTRTPFEGEAIAHHWLQILSSEGFDLVAYLEGEFALHTEQMQLIYSSHGKHSKSYFFRFTRKRLCNQSCLLLGLVQSLYPSSRSNADSKFPTAQYHASFTPCQLVYQWGSNPSVSWDWWIDPNSFASLVREEFKYMDILGWDYRRWDEWEKMWPMIYPAWSDYIRCTGGYVDDPELRLPHELAQERANRRWEKKSMKAARAQGLKKRERMPGAWPV